MLGDISKTGKRRVSPEVKRRYRQSAKGRAAAARYDKGTGLAKHREYDRSEARKASKARYRRSAKGRAVALRYDVKTGHTAPRPPEPTRALTELERLIMEQVRDDRMFQIPRPSLFVPQDWAERIFYGENDFAYLDAISID